MNKKRFFKIATWFGIAIVLAGILIQIRRFYPAGTAELASPPGIRHRLFAEKRSGVSLSIVICASDWPHTFLKPFTLGRANWSDKYSESNFFWSKDGSLVVWRTRQVDWEAAKYESAYDFVNHEAIDSHIGALNLEQCSEKIEYLLNERGGIGSEVTDIPDDKS